MRFQSIIIPSLLAIFLIVMFGKLGFWQLDRARVKEQRVDAFSSAASVSVLPDDTRAKEFTRVSIQGHFMIDKNTLADNQVHEARPGTHVYSPFITLSGEVILVNRGWVPMGSDRSLLPEIVTPKGEIEIVGFIGPMPVPGRQLGEDSKMQEDNWPQLVTYPKVSNISAVLGRDLYPWVLFLDASDPAGFDGRDWKPVFMSPAQHHAYAFQWFALSTATTLGWLFLLIRRRVKQ
jgi:surfeit locus 1 family protein